MTKRIEVRISSVLCGKVGQPPHTKGKSPKRCFLSRRYLWDIAEYAIYCHFMWRVYRWFVRNTKEKMQDKYAGTMNVLLHKGHSWFLLSGEIPFEGKRGTYLCIFTKKKVLSVCSSVFCVDV